MHRDEAGNVVHAEVRMGDSTIWLHLVVVDKSLEAPFRLRPNHGGLIAIVDDVDAHFQHATKAGARVCRPRLNNHTDLENMVHMILSDTYGGLRALSDRRNCRAGLCVSISVRAS